MRPSVRLKRHPAWIGLAAALAGFAVLAIACGLVLVVGVVRSLAGYDAHFFIGLILPTLLVGAGLIAYGGARLIYTSVRWKRIDYDGLTCLECGYNLTGNVSGRCPECGTQVEDRLGPPAHE